MMDRHSTEERLQERLTLSHILPRLEEDWSSATFFQQLKETCADIASDASPSFITSTDGVQTAITQSFGQLFFPHKATAAVISVGGRDANNFLMQQRCRILLAPLFANRLMEDLDAAVRTPLVQCQATVCDEVRVRLQQCGVVWKKDAATSSGGQSAPQSLMAAPPPPHQQQQSYRFLPTEKQFAASLMRNYYPRVVQRGVVLNVGESTTSSSHHAAVVSSGGGLLSTMGVANSVASLGQSWSAWEQKLSRRHMAEVDHEIVSASSPAGSATPSAAHHIAERVVCLLRGAIQSRVRAGTVNDIDKIPMGDEVTGDAHDVGKQCRPVLQPATIAAALEDDLGGATTGEAALWNYSVCCAPLLTIAPQSAELLGRSTTAQSAAGRRLFDPTEVALRSVVASSSRYSGSDAVHQPLDSNDITMTMMSNVVSVSPAVDASEREGGQRHARREHIVNQSAAPAIHMHHAPGQDPTAPTTSAWGASLGNMVPWSLPTEDEVEDDRSLALALRAVQSNNNNTTTTTSVATVRSDSDGEVLMLQPHQRLVFKNGRVVVEDKPAAKQAQGSQRSAVSSRKTGPPIDEHHQQADGSEGADGTVLIPPLTPSEVRTLVLKRIQTSKRKHPWVHLFNVLRIGLEPPMDG